MKRVLIVDTTESIDSNIKRIMEESGCIVVGSIVQDSEAISRYIEFKPDIVALNIYSLKINGFKIITEIREIDKNAKFIVISSAEDKNVIKKAIRLGVASFIVRHQ